MDIHEILSICFRILELQAWLLDKMKVTMFIMYEPHHEKIYLRGFRPGQTRAVQPQKTIEA